jgi:hypothetical protein
MNKFKEYISIAPIISILWLFAGYFYLSNYYGYFGIEVNKYFSINDYVMASIDNLVSISVMVILNFAYMEYAIRRDKVSTKDYYKGWRFKGKYVKDKFLLFSIILYILILIIIKLFKPEMHSIQYFLYLIIFMMIWLEVGNHFHASNYFKDIIVKISSPYIYHTIAFIIPFSLLYLFFTAKFSASYIAEIGNDKKIIIRMSEDNDKSIREYSNFLIIGTNSAYYFLYDKKLKRATIVPIKSIKNIIYQN